NPIIFITKMDLLTESEQATIEAFASDYADIGYDVECLTSKTGHDLTYLEEYFNDKVTVIAGQSGVGKSSILNGLDPSLLIETDDISMRLGRGKHTTRYVELVEIGNGLVADTPGFSALDFSHIELERSEERRVGKEGKDQRSKRDWSSDVCSSDLRWPIGCW